MNGIVSRRASRFATLIFPALLLSGCFFGEGSGPEPIAGTPAPPPEPIPEGFCDPINFEDVCGPFDFIGGGSEPGFEGGVSLIIDNPDKGGLNDTDKVAQMQKFQAESGLTFGGSTLQRPDGIDFTLGESFTMLVWATREVPVLFKFEGLGQERIVNHSGSGGWEELCFDFTGTAVGGAPATGITFIFDVDVLGDAAGNPNDWTFYFDEITQQEESCGGGGPPPGGGAPDVAAPTPTQDPANVISLFSDVYDDVATTWPTEWSSPNNTTGDVTIDGGLVKEHIAINFIGIEFQVDATSMTHLHVDVWTPDATSLLLRLVDFGGDGFEDPPVNDTAGDVTLDAASTPALAQGTWLSLDIPLQTFLDNGLGSVADLNQIVVSPNDGATVYVDNLYFYNDAGGSSGPGAELLTNGDMEAGQDPWFGQATVVDDGGNNVLLGVVTAPDPGQPFLVNASQVVALTEGEIYTLTFRAKATQARSILAGLGLNEAPWTAFVETVPLTTEWQTFTYTITVAGFGIANSRVLFDMNAEAGDVSIDDVSLKQGSLLTNGNMEAGQDPWIGQATVVDDGGNNVLQGVVTAPDPGQPFLVNASQVVELTDEETYVLTFKAKATQEKSILAGLGLNEAPFTAVTESVPLTTEWQTFTYTITTAGVSGANSRVLFDMNAEAGDVSIDDVALAMLGSPDSGGGGAGLGPIDFEAGGLGAAFGWTVFENDDNPALQIIANPDPSGANTSATVAQFTARQAGQPFAGTITADLPTFTLDTSNAIVRIKVWKSVISDVGIKFEDAALGSTGEIRVANTVTDQWEELTFDFSGVIGNPVNTDITSLVIFPDFDARTQENVVYFDDISFSAVP